MPAMPISPGSRAPLRFASSKTTPEISALWEREAPNAASSTNPRMRGCTVPLAVQVVSGCQPPTLYQRASLREVLGPVSADRASHRGVRTVLRARVGGNDDDAEEDETA